MCVCVCVNPSQASHYPTVPITKPLPYARREFPWRTRVLNNQTIPSYDESLRREAQQLKSSGALSNSCGMVEGKGPYVLLCPIVDLLRWSWCLCLVHP